MAPETKGENLWTLLTWLLNTPPMLGDSSNGTQGPYETSPFLRNEPVSQVGLTVTAFLRSQENVGTLFLHKILIHRLMDSKLMVAIGGREGRY